MPTVVPVSSTALANGSAVTRTAQAEKTTMPPTQRRRWRWGSLPRLPPPRPRGAGPRASRTTPGAGTGRRDRAGRRRRASRDDRAGRRGARTGRRPGMIARSTRRCDPKHDHLQARPSTAAEHDGRDRGHPDRDAEQQPRAAREARGHELHVAREREVNLDHELREDRDERHARHRDPGRRVELGCLGGRGEHEGGGHHGAAEEEHAQRGRDRSAAEPARARRAACTPP